MTVVLSDGPLGLEGAHRWLSPDGRSITLNDPSTVPYFSVDKMPGFRALPEADNNRSPHASRRGSSPLPSLVRGKNYTIVGELRSDTLQHARSATQAFLGAFSERSREGTFSHVAQGSYGDPSLFWYSTVRIVEAEVDEDVKKLQQNLYLPYRFDFQITAEMLDPTFKWSVAGEASGSSSCTCVNQGNAAADPIVQVDNPDVGNIIISRGQGISVKLVDAPAGTIVFDFRNRTVMSGGVTVDARLDQSISRWWYFGQQGLPPGSSTVTQVGGSSLTVNWAHSSW